MSDLDRFRSPRRDQIGTRGKAQGRLIRHAGALTPSVFALAVAMIRTPFGALLVAAIGFPALQAAGFFPTSRAAILLAPVTVTAEIEHGPAGRKVTHALTKSCGTGRRHRFGTGGLDNRRRS
ncbi:MAG TPA: hypothetical protein VN620_07100 [Candidatus Methylomirabilis sp.]|nr:hypothetical protein [Candidatus Methylomirabilis sp.]